MVFGCCIALHTLLTCLYMNVKCDCTLRALVFSICRKQNSIISTRIFFNNYFTWKDSFINLPFRMYVHTLCSIEMKMNSKCKTAMMTTSNKAYSVARELTKGNEFELWVAVAVQINWKTVSAQISHSSGFALREIQQIDVSLASLSCSNRTLFRQREHMIAVSAHIDFIYHKVCRLSIVGMIGIVIFVLTHVFTYRKCNKTSDPWRFN